MSSSHPIGPKPKVEFPATSLYLSKLKIYITFPAVAPSHDDYLILARCLIRQENLYAGQPYYLADNQAVIINPSDISALYKLHIALSLIKEKCLSTEDNTSFYLYMLETVFIPAQQELIKLTNLCKDANGDNVANIKSAISEAKRHYQELTQDFSDVELMAARSVDLNTKITQIKKMFAQPTIDKQHEILDDLEFRLSRLKKNYRIFKYGTPPSHTKRLAKGLKVKLKPSNYEQFNSQLLADVGEKINRCKELISELKLRISSNQEPDFSEVKSIMHYIELDLNNCKMPSPVAAELDSPKDSGNIELSFNYPPSSSVLEQKDLRQSSLNQPKDFIKDEQLSPLNELTSKNDQADKIKLLYESISNLLTNQSQQLKKDYPNFYKGLTTIFNNKNATEEFILQQAISQAALALEAPSKSCCLSTRIFSQAKVRPIKPTEKFLTEFSDLDLHQLTDRTVANFLSAIEQISYSFINQNREISSNKNSR